MSNEPENAVDLGEKALQVMRRSQEARPPEPGPEEQAARAQRATEREASRLATLARIRRDRFEAECPPRFRGAQLSQLPEPRLSEISAWAAQPAGRNLVLSGPVGCGKTHGGIAAAREASVGHALDTWIIPATELLEQLRPNGPEGALDRASSVDLLLLDDLGAERPSDWTAERLAMVIDRRWLAARPMIATTNLSLGPSGQLIEALGERSYSRLVGSDAVVLQLQGADRRRS